MKAFAKVAVRARHAPASQGRKSLHRGAVESAPHNQADSTRMFSTEQKFSTHVWGAEGVKVREGGRGTGESEN